jgi:hypothetical protein
MTIFLGAIFGLEGHGYVMKSRPREAQFCVPGRQEELSRGAINQCERDLSFLLR